MKPGDLVRWWTGSGLHHRIVFGRVTRVTPKGTVYAVRLGMDDETEFRQRGGYACEPATALEAALVAWKAQCPSTNHCKVSYPFAGGDDALPTRVVVYDGLPLDQVQAAADELVKIAEWLERMPTQDSLAPAAATEH